MSRADVPTPTMVHPAGPTPTMVVGPAGDRPRFPAGDYSGGVTESNRSPLEPSPRPVLACLPTQRW